MYNIALGVVLLQEVGILHLEAWHTQAHTCHLTVHLWRGCTVLAGPLKLRKLLKIELEVDKLRLVVRVSVTRLNETN